ncbi:MAG: valine--tRNA ligase [Myxococcales bacterium]|nr:valine--tRNA ligase [Myxococcales bacterium]MDH5305925.1 valine--tRNA ligase [Myxococcales bacterium]MDH5566512.1 valine--tRNA ligase [Myxococcales bacterium]
MTLQKPRFASIDAAALPKHFDAAAAEARWGAAWERQGIHLYDPARPRGESFVIDTPPPTASGSLHPGHVFSYTHTDILARYMRMTGRNVFYPMGWDDNGLPTERRVQNYFHIRCDPSAKSDPDLVLEEATAKRRKQRPLKVSRPDFIAACERVTREDERTFKELWQRLGLSVDWSQEYQTIDARARRVAQYSFLDLHAKGQVESRFAPTMWDVDFQSAIAQAEIEERTLPGAYHDIEFGVEGADTGFVISTTRPELLAACVGVTAHPDDARYKNLFGRRAITPLFRVPVPIFASDKADPEKGTGILMVCTFGDATDVEWWREEGLALRQIIARNGCIAPVDFASATYASLDAGAAARFYADMVGMRVDQARALIVGLLARPEGGASGRRAPLVAAPRPIEHAVKFFEKGDRPLEFVPTRQWFVKLLEHREALLAKGDEVIWHPPHMAKRYRDWTENLAQDWCVSRQRYFGVPIPVWYRLDADGAPDYAAPLLPEAERLPVDPTTDVPSGFEEAQRGVPGGFAADPDVFDTWFTSSLTPQISSHWGTDPVRHAALFPADLRPQGQDIIRTWAFYTIAKALLHEGSVPWKHAAISGWILDPDRKKMSKSKGNVVTPLPLIESYTADGVRYWAGGARLGVDTALDEKVFKVGKRLVTKFFNAGKFVLSQTAERHPVHCELDRAFAAKLRALVEKAGRDFEGFHHAQVLQDAESFFWSHFTDTYIELVKLRARDDHASPAARGSAVAALRLGLDVLLRLHAPFLPYITEEVWSWAFAEETGHASIHRAAWPSDADFADIQAPDDAASFDVAVACLAAINKAKADAAVSMGREVLHLSIAANPKTRAKLDPVLADVLAGARCAECALVESDAIEDGAFEIRDVQFAEREVR